MVLGLLAVEGPGSVAAEAGEVHRDARRKGDALVGRPEDHVELDAALIAGGEERFGVESAETVEQRAGVEESRVEEVGRQAPGLGLELAEAEDVRVERKLDELLLGRLHDVCSVFSSAACGSAPAGEAGGSRTF